MRYTLLVLFLVLSGVAFSACSVSTKDNSDASLEAALQKSQTQPQKQEPSMNQDATQSATQPEDVGQLITQDLVVGTGAEAVPGKKITVHYTGKFLDGTKFDSSLDRNQPFTFILGQGQVIEGWDQGFSGMKVGGKRALLIPPDLAYGENGAPPTIPPNTPLTFEVELLKVE